MTGDPAQILPAEEYPEERAICRRPSLHVVCNGSNTERQRKQTMRSKVKNVCAKSVILLAKNQLVQNMFGEKSINRAVKVLCRPLIGQSANRKNKKNMRTDCSSVYTETKKGGSTAKVESKWIPSSFRKKSSKQLNDQLATYGLCVRDIVGDGNCLFRALSDQIDGHCDNHQRYRSEVCDYILQHREEFEPFFHEGQSFEQAVKCLRQPGVFAGNEALVAFSRLKSVDIVIHQANQSPWRVQCGSEPPASELHICYHEYQHYSSVRKIGDKSADPGNIQLDKLTLKEKVRSDPINKWMIGLQRFRRNAGGSTPSSRISAVDI